MASAMRVFRKFQSSDGRIKIATLSGVSVMVVVIAMLVGVLPVFADHSTSKITPGPNDEGGGAGKCSVETGDLPSAAGKEFHINNPTPGFHVSADNAIQIHVRDTERGRVFNFTVLNDDYVVYDVVVNGGPKSNHYDYDGSTIGPVSDDVDLHAPKRGNSLHNLSHINLCYDVPGLYLVDCDVDATRLEGNGDLSAVEVSIFQNSLWDCTSKRALLNIVDDVATVSFEGDGSDTIAGRLDFYKLVADPSSFEDLEYDGPGDFVPLQWCATRTKDTTPDAAGLFDGDEFDDVLDPENVLTAAQTKYPSLVDVTDTLDNDTPDDTTDDTTVQATACKVAEIENAAGAQHTVVYFEFEDPQFR